MADFFKGLTGGFQTGLQLGQQLRQRRMEDDLAQAYAKPEEFTDYTPEQQKQIQGLQAAGGYDVQAVPGAEGAAPTLRYSARQGANYYDDMGQPEAPIEVAPQRVQRYGGQTVAGQFNPTELRGLQMQEAARVLGSYGDVKGAAALQAQAEEQAYQARIRPMQEEQMRQQGILTQGQIEDRQRVRTRETKIDAVDADVAQWMGKRLTGPDGEPRQPSMDDNIAQLQYRATALQKAGLAKEATDSLKDYQSFAVNQITLDEKARNSQLGAVALAISAGDLEPARAFYDRYVLDGAKVTDMKTDPKTGAITISRVRDDGAEMPDKVLKGGANELLAALDSFRDPRSLYNFSQNEFKNNLDLRKTVSAEDVAKSTIGLNNARAGQIKQMNEALATNLKNSDEAKQIQSQYAGLNEDNDPGGAKRQSLITQFNMLSVKAGGTIPVGSGGKKGSVLETPVEQKKNDDGTYTAFSKDGGKALYNTFNGEAIPLGMTVDVYSKMKADAQKNGVALITGEDNGRLVLKFAGPDGKFYDDAEKAKYAKPEAKPAAGKPEGLSTAAPTAAASAPTPPTAKPVRADGESFTAFRDRTIAWDRNKIAYEQMVKESQLRERLSKNAVGLQRPLVQ